jgi:gamma-D-glutamyl-L-lysine dipeptidyl-peptidase
MRCGVEVASVRAGPDDAAPQVTQALRGDPLQAGERVPGWVHVTTAYGYPGWVREQELCGDDPVSLARTFLGSPYEWGGLTSSGIDCSGLVHLAYRLAGVLVPRDSWQQEVAGDAVAPGDERPGDLVTYGDGGRRADHIAFWVGDERILHATARDGLGVVEEPEPDELRARRRRVARLPLNNCKSA